MRGEKRYAGDLTGQKFGKLTVKRHEGSGNGGHRWLCLCDCGAIATRTSGKLRDKHNPNPSCGCGNKDSIAKASAAAWAVTTKFRHPLKTKIKHLWRNIMKRCYDPRDQRYSDYGGRGITVCEEWKNDRYKFYDWCVNNGIQKHLSIDRKDNSGPYAPENCRWATGIEQANNSRKNVWVEWNGRRQTVAQWAREFSVRPTVLLSRLRDGWDMERAITQPVRRQ